VKKDVSIVKKGISVKQPQGKPVSMDMYMDDPKGFEKIGPGSGKSKK